MRYSRFSKRIANLFPLKLKLALANSYINRKFIFASLSLFPSAFKTAIEIYRAFFSNPQGKVSIVVLMEHIGDLVTCEPIARQLKAKAPNSKVIWIVDAKYTSIVNLFESVDSVISVQCISHWLYTKLFIIKPLFDIYNLHFDRRICSEYHLTMYNKANGITYDNFYENNRTLLEAFSISAGLRPLDLKPSLLLPDVDLDIDYDRYIVIQTTSNDPCRNWTIEGWKTLISAFPNIQFVEVGLTPTLTELPNCSTAYCGALSLMQSFKLIANAKGFWGIDSGMAHVANAYNIPSMILLGVLYKFAEYNPLSGIKDNLSFKVIRCNKPVEHLAPSIVLQEAQHFIDNL